LLPNSVRRQAVGRQAICDGKRRILTLFGSHPDCHPSDEDLSPGTPVGAALEAT